MNVYVVNLRSTGQVWNTFVCAHYAAMLNALNFYDIITRTDNGLEDDRYQEFVNPNDSTQTATVAMMSVIN